MSTKNTESSGNGRDAALSSAAIARRRILLKGVGKGATVLAATVPIKTLAGQGLLTVDSTSCSVSGMHSGVHSAATTTAVCGGYSPGWWGQSNADGTPKNWPRGLNSASYVTAVFKNSKLQNANGSVPTLFQVMSPKDKSDKFSNTDEFHWVGAWLNAITHSFNFPYSDDQVLAFYNQGSTSTGYIDALSFFKKYMETHIG